MLGHSWGSGTWRLIPHVGARAWGKRDRSRSQAGGLETRLLLPGWPRMVTNARQPAEDWVGALNVLCVLESTFLSFCISFPFPSLLPVETPGLNAKSQYQWIPCSPFSSLLFLIRSITRYLFPLTFCPFLYFLVLFSLISIWSLASSYLLALLIFLLPNAVLISGALSLSFSLSLSFPFSPFHASFPTLFVSFCAFHS